jgi:hypothetical protein
MAGDIRRAAPVDSPPLIGVPSAASERSPLRGDYRTALLAPSQFVLARVVLSPPVQAPTPCLPLAAAAPPGRSGPGRRRRRQAPTAACILSATRSLPALQHERQMASAFGRVATMPAMKKLLLLIVLAALATLAAKKVRSV